MRVVRLGAFLLERGPHPTLSQRERVLTLVLLTASLFLSACTHSGGSNMCARLADVPHATAACVVQDPKTGSILSEYQSQRLLVPASTQKLVTYLVALKALGPDYRFHTTLYQLPGGEVGLRMGGDPTLTMADLRALLEKMPKNARLRVDDTAILLSPYAPGVAVEDLQFCFAAPLSAVMLGTNCTSIKLVPTQAGQKVRLVLEDPWMTSFVENRVRSEENCPANGGALLQEQEGLKTVLTGCLPAGGEVFPLRLPIRHPREALRMALEAIGVRHVHYAALPPGEHPTLSDHASEDLQTISVVAMKESDNLKLSALFAAIMAKHQIQTWPEAGKKLRELTHHYYGVAPGRVSMWDGSGWSRYNQMTAGYLAQLLYQAYQDPEIYALLKETFPRNGMDGTLKKRLAEEGIRGKIYAKTGGLKGISNLAGYMQLRGHEEILVLFLNFWPLEQGAASMQLDKVIMGAR